MKISPKKSSVSNIEFVKELAHRGCRIFTTQAAREIAQDLGFNVRYVKEFLFHLKNEKWIHPLKRGLYTLDSLFLDGIPIHEFEIAMALAPNSVISFYSAFQYHKLTLQIPSVIYLTIPISQNLPKVGKEKNVLIRHVKYEFVQTKKAFYFGYQKIWLHNAQIMMTDLERTLLDGLRKPQYCGSFIEVFNSYKNALDRANLGKLIDYSLKLETAMIKRLGYVLEQCGVQEKTLHPLLKVKASSFFKLDNQGLDEGSYNKKWMIRENI